MTKFFCKHVQTPPCFWKLNLLHKKHQHNPYFCSAWSSPMTRPLNLSRFPFVRIWHCSHVRCCLVKGHLAEVDNTACTAICTHDLNSPKVSTQSEAFLYRYLQKCEARLPSRRAQDVTVRGYGGRYDLVHGDRVYPAGEGIAAVYVFTSVPLFESLVASQSRPSAGSIQM